MKGRGRRRKRKEEEERQREIPHRHCLSQLDMGLCYLHQEKVLQTLESGMEFLKVIDPKKELAERRGGIR